MYNIFNHKIKKQYIYVVLIFISFYLIHYLLNGYYSLRVEDLLDNEIVYNKIIGDYYKYGSELSFDLLLNGNHEYLSLRRLYHPNTLLYFLFSSETAYIINDIINLSVSDKNKYILNMLKENKELKKTDEVNDTVDQIKKLNLMLIDTPIEILKEELEILKN